MLDSLIKFVFKIITTVADIVLSPLISGITALFPSLSTYFGYIGQFLDTGLTYVAFIREFMLIPRGAIILLFDYYAIKYSIYIFKVAFNFVINIYNKLKP